MHTTESRFGHIYAVKKSLLQLFGKVCIMKIIEYLVYTQKREDTDDLLAASRTINYQMDTTLPSGDVVEKYEIKLRRCIV